VFIKAKPVVNVGMLQDPLGIEKSELQIAVLVTQVHAHVYNVPDKQAVTGVLLEIINILISILIHFELSVGVQVKMQEVVN